MPRTTPLAILCLGLASCYTPPLDVSLVHHRPLVRPRTAPSDLQRGVRPTPTPRPVVRRVVPAPVRSRALPELTAEPEVRLLVGRGESLTIRLLQTATAPGGQSLPPQSIRFYVAGGRIFGSNDARGMDGERVRLDFAAAHHHPTFEIDGRTYGGALTLARAGHRVLAMEVLPMERYLLGVLAREVSPGWPPASLEAQAVVARSYACARWAARYDEPWHLGASEVVDMAYAGFQATPDSRFVSAVERTRGQLLWFRDQPLPAYFHAASGGHTSAHDVIWPDRTMPDGVSDPSPAMPSRPDPWAASGVALAPRRLGNWSLRIPLAELGRRLRAKGHQVGEPVALRLGSRSPSGRARDVFVDSDRGRLVLTAHALRMAISPREIKSTLWTDVGFSATHAVIRGQGFGHGVGMPQASAWAMARAGHGAGAILRQYYPEAALVDRW